MRANVLLDEGPTPSEIRQIERRLRFEFNTDHRRLLETVQPAGTGWLHCKKDSVEHIRVALDWPLEGLLFDAENNDFWPDGWCPKLASTSDQSRIATEHIETWPTLIPLTGIGTCQRRQRLPGAPVFSGYQSDVIVYGRDLLEYLQHELRPAQRPAPIDDENRKMTAALRRRRGRIGVSHEDPPCSGCAHILPGVLHLSQPFTTRRARHLTDVGPWALVSGNLASNLTDPNGPTLFGNGNGYEQTAHVAGPVVDEA